MVENRYYVLATSLRNAIDMASSKQCRFGLAIRGDGIRLLEVPNAGYLHAFESMDVAATIRYIQEHHELRISPSPRIETLVVLEASEKGISSNDRLKVTRLNEDIYHLAPVKRQTTIPVRVYTTKGTQIPQKHRKERIIVRKKK
ncbi:MAG: hypothetical protein JSW08_02955 [archaeon]|nr:MAG: hypothetical protein JSW08_02955 [archaeon]